MTTKDEALLLAKHALENTARFGHPLSLMAQDAIAACKEALAAPQTTGNIVMDSYKQMVAMKEAAPQGEPYILESAAQLLIDTAYKRGKRDGRLGLSSPAPLTDDAAKVPQDIEGVPV